jgi:hypothetical protein
MPKKQTNRKSTKITIKNEVIDDNDNDNENNIDVKLLNSKILKQQKLTHEINVSNFLKNAGVIILSS